jgi:hypothetical protein
MEFNPYNSRGENRRQFAIAWMRECAQRVSLDLRIPSTKRSSINYPLKGIRTSDVASIDQHLAETGAAWVCPEIAALLHPRGRLFGQANSGGKRSLKPS